MYLQLKKVSKSYGRERALNQVDLVLNQGDFALIVGKSGSGKSTLLKSIALYQSIDEGEIIFCDQEIQNFSRKQIDEFHRTKIGFVFQFFNLLEDHTIYENIILPLYLSGKKVQSYEVDAVMKCLGIEKIKDQIVSTCSGGEKQRCAIARAIIHHPKLLLCDEPTGNLDSENSLLVIELLKEIANRYQLTVLMVTHERQMTSYGNRLLELKDGRLYEHQK